METDRSTADGRRGVRAGLLFCWLGLGAGARAPGHGHGLFSFFWWIMSSGYVGTPLFWFWTDKQEVLMLCPLSLHSLFAVAILMLLCFSFINKTTTTTKLLLSFGTPMFSSKFPSFFFPKRIPSFFFLSFDETNHQLSIFPACDIGVHSLCHTTLLSPFVTDRSVDLS